MLNRFHCTNRGLSRMSEPSCLPANFKSLYRLFLRIASTAVLHQPRASRNLRRRWRPTFDDAARVTREVQKGEASGSECSRQGIEWLKLWHKRMDNTLELLYTASHTRGIPHLVTRSLAFTIEDERQRAVAKLQARKAWQPSNPMSAMQNVKSIEKKKKAESMHDNTLGALNEILKMAEASANITLGTNIVPLGRYVHRRPRK